MVHDAVWSDTTWFATNVQALNETTDARGKPRSHDPYYCRSWETSQEVLIAATLSMILMGLFVLLVKVS